ncbi:hypothetical protein KEM52_006187 [Ascosphaera acerosa]|nr:hypothetical protein KEM52_006187 [Ascosphaera acerosa]
MTSQVTEEKVDIMASAKGHDDQLSPAPEVAYSLHNSSPHEDDSGNLEPASQSLNHRCGASAPIIIADNTRQRSSSSGNDRPRVVVAKRRRRSVPDFFTCSSDSSEASDAEDAQTPVSSATTDPSPLAARYSHHRPHPQRDEPEYDTEPDPSEKVARSLWDDLSSDSEEEDSDDDGRDAVGALLPSDDPSDGEDDEEDEDDDDDDDEEDESDDDDDDDDDDDQGGVEQSQPSLEHDYRIVFSNDSDDEVDEDDDPDDDADGPTQAWKARTTGSDAAPAAGDSAEDDGGSAGVTYARTDSMVSFSNEVQYYQRPNDEESEEEEQPQMTMHELMILRQKESLEAPTVSWSWEDSPEDVEMDMDLIRAQLNCIATLPAEPFRVIIQSQTRNCVCDADPNKIAESQRLGIRGYLDKLSDTFYDAFPRLITHDAYDRYVDMAAGVLSFDEEDELVCEEGSTALQSSLGNDIRLTLQEHGIKFKEDVIWYVSGELLEHLGRCAAANMLFAQLEDKQQDGTRQESDAASGEEQGQAAQARAPSSSSSP